MVNEVAEENLDRNEETGYAAREVEILMGMM